MQSYTAFSNSGALQFQWLRFCVYSNYNRLEELQKLQDAAGQAVPVNVCLCCCTAQDSHIDVKRMLEAPAGLGLQCSVALLFGLCFALLNPKTSIFVQKRHPYTANLNSEMSGDSKNVFLHCGDVIGASASSLMSRMHEQHRMIATDRTTVYCSQH